MSRVNYSLLVIGAGGTGTYVLKELSRFLYDNNRKISRMTIFDGDTVELKNLSRQAFQSEDIGQNKAAVMADILSSAFDLRWESYGEYLLDSKTLDNFLYHNTVPLIVGCVDNHACRMVLEDYFNSHENCFYLDSANEYDTGEVIFSYKVEGQVLSPCRSHYFPKIREKSKARNEISCEELNNVSPQHIATNMTAGNILLTEICSILNDKPHPGMVTFDTGMFSQEFIPYTAMVKKEAA